jgi:hypothetical protein
MGPVTCIGEQDPYQLPVMQGRTIQVGCCRRYNPLNYGISPTLLMTTVVLSNRAVISSVPPSASM